MQAQAAPDRTTDFQGNFISDNIACVPLSGAHFQADTRKVHKILKIYLLAETAEQWITSIEKRTNGQDNFDALRLHYSGEGIVSRRVAVVDCLQGTLDYNSERALSLNTFLGRLQKMFNIFRDEEEPMTYSTQVH